MNAKNAAAVWGRALAAILRGQSREEKFYVEKFLPSAFFFDMAILDSTELSTGD